MNERIKQIAFEAGQGGHSWYNDPNCIQAFAELIVKECMTTVLKESKWYWDRDEFESSNAIQNAARRVKKHFGVEE